jgi:hypothetical protein
MRRPPGTNTVLSFERIISWVPPDDAAKTRAAGRAEDARKERAVLGRWLSADGNEDVEFLPNNVCVVGTKARLVSDWEHLQLLSAVVLGRSTGILNFWS